MFFASLSNYLCLKSNKELDENEFRLKKVLKVAEEIINKNPKAIIQFMALLGRKYQSEYLVKAVSTIDEHKVPNLEPKIVWFKDSVHLNSKGETLNSIKQRIDMDASLKLSCDLVLPWPWSIHRVVNTLSSIGAGKCSGGWRQDYNHVVELWMPFCLGWVHKGNHSITSGISQGEGEIKPSSIYDVSSIFDLVKFDGTYFVRIEDGKRISEKVIDFEFACIFEVGRLIHNKKLPYQLL